MKYLLDNCQLLAYIKFLIVEEPKMQYVVIKNPEASVSMFLRISAFGLLSWVKTREAATKFDSLDAAQNMRIISNSPTAEVI